MYCNGYSGKVLRNLSEHPMMGPYAVEVKLDGWGFPVVLSARQMEMFIKVTG